MDVLQKINELKNQRKWSVYKLSEESGVSQSTIANMFSRKTLPSLTTLEELCNAFGITMAEFFGFNQNEISSQEALLLGNFRKLNDRDKKIIEALIEKMKDN